MAGFATFIIYQNLNHNSGIVSTMKKGAQNTSGNLLITDYMKGKKIDPIRSKTHLNPTLNKTKKHDNPQDYHQSSKQADSDATQKLPDSDNPRPNYKQESCLQMIMIGPTDVHYFESSHKKIKTLLQNYKKESVIHLMLDNAKYFKIMNLKNLQAIDNDVFWSLTMPQLLEYAGNRHYQQTISSKVQMLIPGQDQIIKLSRGQILMIILNMFLFTLPKQTHRLGLHFGHWMEIKDKQRDKPENAILKIQKLKCLIQYLKSATEQSFQKLDKEEISFQRVKNQLEVSNLIDQVLLRFMDVEIQKGLIQDKNDHDIMVDFANKKIGGGVLSNGAVQEEILFLKFTELFALIPITYEIEQNEAIIVYHAKKWANGQGYSSDFKWKPKRQKTSKKEERDYIFIAIDAVNYSNSLCKGKSQYKKGEIYRQIEKAYTGFAGVDYGAQKDMKIRTGRWGCGFFKGDLYLKFLIQWIAATLANKNLVYMAQDQDEQKELKILVKFIQMKFNVNEVLETMLEFNRYLKEDKNLDFLQFIKGALS